jgi:hypothetical protein
MKYLIICMLDTIMIALGFIITPSALAAAQVLNVPVSFSSQGPTGCANEIIQFSGTDHIVSQIMPDPSGGFHINIQSNLIGTGIGQTTGDRYITLDTVKVVSANEHIAQEFTDGFTSNLIDTSSGAHILFKYVEHLTVNPDGTLTAFVVHVNFPFTCA